MCYMCNSFLHSTCCTPDLRFISARSTCNTGNRYYILILTCILMLMLKLELRQVMQPRSEAPNAGVRALHVHVALQDLLVPVRGVEAGEPCLSLCHPHFTGRMQGLINGPFGLLGRMGRKKHDVTLSQEAVLSKHKNAVSMMLYTQ